MINNTKDLIEKYSDNDFREKFSNIFSIANILAKCIRTKDFEIPENLVEIIVLTDLGQELLEELRSIYQQASEKELKLGIFVHFYHDDLYINIENTSYEGLLNFCNKLLKNETILFPWIYGRVLYDKYFEEFNGGDEILEIDNVLKLLDNTPKGVFQYKNLTIGPYGILKSNNHRYIPTMQDIPLWHCSDPSCSVFHHVKFQNNNDLLSEITNEINEINLSKSYSSWSRFYFHIIEKENYYYDYDRISDFPLMLINSFNLEELKLLFKSLLDNNGNMRATFPDIKELKGSTENILSNLSIDKCFQLILLENDETIIKVIEELIDKKLIDIPATEVRTSSLSLSGGFYNIKNECNRLGIRSISDDSNQSLIRLVKTIEEVNQDEILKEDLEWRLMDFKKSSLKETIENYVLTETPRTIIKETILNGRRQTQKVIKMFYGNFSFPNSETDKDIMIDKLLWKMGFNVNIYPALLNEFWKKLDLFQNSFNLNEEFNEESKDNIRSAAVNFFVKLEEVLEHSLSYLTWTLFSDHYLITKFEYNFEDARNFMCKKLNGRSIGENILKLDNSGGNNLYGLIEGFTALIDLCEENLKDRESFLRPKYELPHFHEKAELTTFPFKHNILLCDLKKEDFEELKNLALQLPRLFNKTKVASVRNRLEHKSQVKNKINNFPKGDEIKDACNCIREQINILENSGLYPKVYLFKQFIKDEYNRSSYELQDYKGNIIKLSPIERFEGSKQPSFRSPQLIFSILSIGNSCEYMRFSYKENSEYLKMCKDFPRKKLLPIPTIENILEISS